jgi:hypothetical protein
MKMISLIFACTVVFGSAAACAQTPQTPSPAGKNSGNVRVVVAAPAHGAPGNAINVQIDYAGLPASGVSVTYVAEKELTLGSRATANLTPDKAGEAHDTVVVEAKTAGVYFVNVFATARGVTQAVSIPVTVGQAVLKPRAASAIARPDGETVIEMPAQQKVR